MSTLTKKFRYFSESDKNFGNITKINGFLLNILDPLREFVGLPMGINAGYAPGTGHTSNSQHYVGNAIDFHFSKDPKTGLFISYRQQIDKVLGFLIDYQIADRCGFGIYPTWNTPGFHLDCRGTKVRWGFQGETQISFEDALKLISG
jgi:hypothetical protein